MEFVSSLFDYFVLHFIVLQMLMHILKKNPTWQFNLTLAIINLLN